jgi:hypothetical protein
MIENLPSYISTIFGLTTLATLFQFSLVLFYSKTENTRSKITNIIVCLTIWLLVQMIISFKNFYSEDTFSFPPRFALLVLPPLITVLLLFITRSGRIFIDSLPLLNLTYLHIVRIPVELVLYWLFINKKVPELMTFAGRNFDILSGITAPLIAFFGIKKKLFGNKILLAWNFICLALLLNIVINAVLSAPFAFQKFAFDQPNVAVLYYPFTWLPCFIVPVVLFCHLASIRILLKNNKAN